MTTTFVANAVRANVPDADAFNSARIAAGNTVAEAARLIGVDERTLRRYTSGEVTHPSNLVAKAITKQYKRWAQ
jgi:predicted transcriptional regulator